MDPLTLPSRRETSLEGPGEQPLPRFPTATEQEVRHAAWMKYDAATQDVTLDCTKYRDEDLCGTERVEGRLAARQPGDAQVFSADDVRQKGIGDCYMLGVAAALTVAKGGQRLLEEAIQEKRDSAAGTVSYSVTLYRAEGGDRATPVRFTFDDKFAKEHAEPRACGGGAKDCKEVWAAVLEKAFAQLSGGYSQIQKGGYVRLAIVALTGRPPSAIRTFEDPSTAGTGVAALAERVRQGELMVLQSGPTVPTAEGPGAIAIRPNHAYAVLEVRGTPGNERAVVYDTGLGTRQLVPLADVPRYFTAGFAAKAE